MLSIWRILQRGSAPTRMVDYRAREDPRQRLRRVRNLMQGRMGLRGHLPEATHQTVPVDPIGSACPCLVDLKEVKEVNIRFGQRDIPIIALCGKASFYLVAVCGIVFPGMYSVWGNSRGSLWTRNSAWRPLEMRSCWWEESHRFFHSDQGVSSVSSGRRNTSFTEGFWD